MSDDAKAARRRTRTGCLTCRTRRIKCDEGRPACRRCDEGNIECLGYERKRHLDLLPRLEQIVDHDPHPQPEPFAAPLAFSISPSSARQPAAAQQPSYQYRADGLPLVGLPSNPSLSQRPCNSARSVLGYHQYLFRTASLLFPTQHLAFWREELCQQAWGVESLFLAMTALGTIHRARLQLDMAGEADQDRGQDTQVIANQMYTQALHHLARDLSEARIPSPLLAATCVLLAFFESLMGNITATYEHTKAGASLLKSSQAKTNDATIWHTHTVDAGLHALWGSLRLAIPLLSMPTKVHQNRLFPVEYSETADQDAAATPTTLLHRQLLDLVSIDARIETAIWGTVPFWFNPLPRNVLHEMQSSLQDWAQENQPKLLDFQPSTDSIPPRGGAHWESRYPLPPTPYLSASAPVSVTAALYYFFIGRTCWALALLDDDDDSVTANEQAAYDFFYQSLRVTETLVSNRARSQSSTPSRYIPCEMLQPGLLHMLYIIGQCSPTPSWLRYTANHLNDIKHEGLMHGWVMAQSLEIFHALQYRDSRGIYQYPAPSYRAVCFLVPQSERPGFVCYYAQRRSDSGHSRRNKHYNYLGIARLGYTNTSMDQLSNNRSMQDYALVDAPTDKDIALTADWLRGCRIMQDWQRRLDTVDFSTDQAIHDHVSGGHLYPAVSSTEVD